MQRLKMRLLLKLQPRPTPPLQEGCRGRQQALGSLRCHDLCLHPQAKAKAEKAYRKAVEKADKQIAKALAKK